VGSSTDNAQAVATPALGLSQSLRLRFILQNRGGQTFSTEGRIEIFIATEPHILHILHL